MFVALRDLRFARGRFVLIGSVVALITVLVGFLSGLTGGLAMQSISGILAIPADRIVFAAPEKGSDGVGFADSALTPQQASGWASFDGVTSVEPIGISQTRAQSGDTHAAVAVFGVRPGFSDTSPSTNGLLGLSTPAADELGASAGDTVTIAGATYRVETVAGDAWYSHTPVIEMTLHDWQAYSAATGNPDVYATVLAVNGTPDWSGADAENSTTSETTLASLTALSAFRSEIGSLLMMIGMLFGISGLVVGAFFTVWTMQRKSDVAVLKALGASTASLVRDALGQAGIVLAVGVGLGLGLVMLFGAIAPASLPFMLSPLTTLLPAVIMIGLGLAGAVFALRSVTSADPLTALGSNR
ncbi:FtsX-like permease family protein [Aldersonia kunmingensis]|uniref:FtsX-like permease family protein n=1 Tax=Aldersonia kunmingensis TaxID=408066 RepID=UPI00082C57E4|nr:ABC transporter permease [Aldersonia kunmingensis]